MTQTSTLTTKQRLKTFLWLNRMTGFTWTDFDCLRDIDVKAFHELMLEIGG